jgi:hypothetical protein
MKLSLSANSRVKFANDNKWWTVRAADGRYAILTRQADFKPKGTSFYTIIDWERDLRGPCNLIGQGWDIDEPEGPETLLAALNGPDEHGLTVEVSYRNNVPIDIREVR